ncbi:hypothetical protein H2201_000254 [Coniosporium apollinis]|uniref:NFACT RNA-binding domain-containing protein n=1 Tax=Coniosporium apollinis TaxID=61459 RepID=A0ABQ9P4U7_9PEZI|nr:hypothetical protein H2201_000254 [Coniosporium apollinis]
MVYYFTSNTVSPSAFIYVGKDKVENEELIKYGWEEDVCAHIYVRLQEGQSWDAIPKALLEDCAQLTKANSIEGPTSDPAQQQMTQTLILHAGNKKDNITVIYTPWSNLKKDGSMAVKKIHVAQRENPIVNRLNKTKVEKFPDLRQEKDDRQKELRRKDRAAQTSRQKEEARIAKERKEKAWQRDHAYDDLHSEDALASSSNQDRDADFLDDFM